MRTIKRAAPLAMLAVTLVYFLVNVAYLAVVDKEEIVGSGRIVAALHFGKLWGVGAERVSFVLCPRRRSNADFLVGCEYHRGDVDAREHSCSAVHTWPWYV